MIVIIVHPFDNLIFKKRDEWVGCEYSHYQHESWKCICSETFFHLGLFREHLAIFHSTTENTKGYFGLINDRYIGANYQVSFYCIFCEKIIKLYKKGTDAWKERINHLDGHFTGDCKPKFRICDYDIEETVCRRVRKFGDLNQRS